MVGIRFLIYGSDQNNITSLKDMIDGIYPGSHIYAAGDKKQGMDLVARKEPNVIIIYISKNDNSGYDFCALIKEDPSHFEIPVMFAAKDIDDIHIKESILDLADGYISLPIDRSELIIQLKTMVKLGQAKKSTSHIKELNEEINKEKEARIEIENRCRLLESNMSDIIFTADLDLNFDYISSNSENFISDTKNCLANCFTDDSLFKINKLLEKELKKENDPFIDKNRTRIIKAEIVSNDCNSRLVSLHVSFIRDKEGRAIGLKGAIRDITLEEKLRENLSFSEKQLKLIFDHMQHGLALCEIICDENGDPADYRFISVNISYERLTGLNRKDITGNTFIDVCPHSDKSLISIFGKVALDGKPEQIEYYSKEEERYFKINVYSPKTGQFVLMFDDVSDEKKAEHLISSSEKQFRSLFENSPVSIIIHDKQTGEVIDANSMTYMEYDYSSIQELRSHDFSLEQPYSRTDALNWIHKASLEGKQEFEWTSQNASGQLRFKKVFLSPITFNGAERIMATSIDITDIKLAEQALARSEEKHRQLFENMTQGVVYQDKEGMIIMANAAAERILGVSFDQMQGRTSKDPEWQSISEDGKILPGSEHPSTITLRTGKKTGPFIMGVYNPKKEERVWILINSVPIFHSGEKKPDQVYAIFEDVTRQKEAESALLESEVKYRGLFEAEKDGILIIQAHDGKIIDVNPYMIKLIGCKKDELINGIVCEIKYFYEITEKDRGFANLKKKKYIRYENIVLYTVSGRKIDIEAVLNLYSVNRKRFIQCNIRDITERKHMEQLLIETNKRFSNISSQVPGMLYQFMKRADGKYCAPYCSSRSKELFGCLPEDVRDNWDPISNTIISADKPNVLLTIQESERTMSQWSCEFRIMLPGQPVKWIFGNSMPEKKSDGSIVWSGYLIDITNRKRAEEEMTHMIYHDHLTGLYNRRFFEEEINRLDIPGNLPISVIMFDVNGLKLINDSFGHYLGDELLKKTAMIIENGCRPDDICARLGGDEFAIILTKTDALQALQIANKIKGEAIKEKVMGFELSISYGYDTKSAEEQSILGILANAENHMYRRKLYVRSSMRSKTIDIVMNTLFEKSCRESDHSKRVSGVCLSIAEHMGFSEVDMAKIKTAGLIHDIGKIGIDERILNKEGILEVDEWEEMKKHLEIGWRILSTTDEFSEISDYILCHQEKWYGSGYPNGIKDEKIPLEARIITIADAYDAMTSERSYREPLTKEEAIAEIKRCSGSHFDPKVAAVFIEKVLSENKEDDKADPYLGCEKDKLK